MKYRDAVDKLMSQFSTRLIGTKSFQPILERPSDGARIYIKDLADLGSNPTVKQIRNIIKWN